MGNWVLEGQLSGVEKHSAKAEVFEECVILAGVAVFRITDYRTIDMAHMTPQLMTTAGSGKELHVRIACRVVSTRRKGVFYSGKRFVLGLRFLRFIAFGFGATIQHFAQRVIDRSIVGGETAGDGLVAFVDLAAFELAFHFDQGDFVDGEEQHAGGGFVESVNGVDASAYLIA